MIVNFKAYTPIISEDVFIAENSCVIGNCKIEEGCSIWYNAVLRADVNKITIGKKSNIQDGVVVHCDTNHGTSIGEGVTVGHNAIIHGCTINDNCIIGMGSTILDGACIGKNCIIGANTLVTSGKIIPDNSLAVGSPVRVIRILTEEEIAAIKKSAERYCELTKEYQK